MSINDQYSINLLDKIRIEKGVNELNNFFLTLIRNNKNEAINLINDKTLCFTSLFILKTNIKENNLLKDLNSRNETALQIVDELLTRSSSSEKTFSDSKQTTLNVLRWILETGFHDDGLSDEFDEVLDIVSALLIADYKDVTILPIVSKIIFERNRKGTLIHDIVWAFFQSNSPRCISLIGEGLRSSDPKDAKLAKKLLSFIPEIYINSYGDNESLYISFMNWFRENEPFLSFTGESFQQCSEPSPCCVRLDSKYLCKLSQVDDTMRSSLIPEEEQQLLTMFNNLDEQTKTILSKFSFLLFKQNPYYWILWIKSPIEYQIKIARTNLSIT